MPPELTEVLGRLLADPALRAEFRRDPEGTSARLGAPLRGIDPGALERQAASLVAKRLHETAKLMPRTFRRLGPAARELFGGFATTFWPRGHRRHLEDAVAFGRFLLAGGVRALSRSEFNRLRFALEGGRWALRLVGDAPARGRKRPALQVLWRDNTGSVRSAALWIGLPF